jgi:LemA protein
MRNYLIGFGILIALIIFYSISTYNTMISSQQNVQSSWAQVQNVYQRRADLIPNLVSTVKAYAKHERSTLEDVVKARSAAVSVPAVSLPQDPAQIAQLEKAQQSLSQALSRLMVVVERYPDLKASQNFMALQVELAGTENRIAVERRRFNEAAQQYNAYILRFPQNLIASRFQFKPVAYFQADPTAQTVPKVNFDQ